MFNVRIDKECGCFKRSDFQNNQSFENKDDALIEAMTIAKTMNDTFCKKHVFHVLEEENDMRISVSANG